MMGDRMSEEDIARCRETFSFYDKDNDGFIHVSEIGEAVRILGRNPTQAEVVDLVKTIDSEGKGLVDFTRFLVLMSQPINDGETIEDVMEAFRVFDKDGSGYISAAELRHAMTNLGEKMPDEDVDEMIREADVAGDGQIKYDAFTKIILMKNF
ncbi:neo-calmodulin-like [Tubulanus polymorphus]|uniref:neo-calmodulin-like n=1 Tax=Tubulanus polymorphus TaxID=672921 RepID=UPI003DA5DEF3